MNRVATVKMIQTPNQKAAQNTNCQGGKPQLSPKQKSHQKSTKRKKPNQNFLYPRTEGFIKYRTERYFGEFFGTEA